jgi:hypothetical protein
MPGELISAGELFAVFGLQWNCSYKNISILLLAQTRTDSHARKNGSTLLQEQLLINISATRFFMDYLFLQDTLHSDKQTILYAAFHAHLSILGL